MARLADDVGTGLKLSVETSKVEKEREISMEWKQEPRVRCKS